MQIKYRVIGGNNRPLDPMDFPEFERAAAQHHANRLGMAGGSSKPIPEPLHYSLEWAKLHLEWYGNEHPDEADALWIEETVSRKVG